MQYIQQNKPLMIKPGSCWNTTGSSNRWFKFVATTTQIKVQVKQVGSEGTLQYPYMALWQSNGTRQKLCKLFFPIF